MATTVTARVKASIAANWSKGLDLGDVQATPTSSFSLQLTSGAGANKIEQVATASGTITASGTVDATVATRVERIANELVTDWRDRMNALSVEQ